MNIPTKVLKNTTSIPSHTISAHQHLAKKYYKIHQKRKIKNEGEQVALVNNMYSNCNDSSNLQMEILKWFFSLEPKRRFQICSIENKWLVNILHQMYFHYKLDNKTKFQMRSEENEEIFPNIIYTNSFNGLTTPLMHLNVSHFNNYSDQNINHYCYFFSGTNVNQFNNFLSEKNNEYDVEFLNEIRFFKLNEYVDTITLSYKILSDENMFKKYFEFFSNNKFFTNFMLPLYDSTNKNYNFSFPEWLNCTKEIYSLSQYLAAYFEQTISIAYFMHKNLDLKTFSNMFLANEKITCLIEESGKIINFLKKEYKGEKNEKRKMYDEINLRSITTDIRKDMKIAELVKSKKLIKDDISYSIFNHNHWNYDTIPNWDDLENNTKKLLFCKTEDEYVYSLNFASFDSIYTFDDFYFKKLYYEIHNLYTRKNALELIFEEELSAKSTKETRKYSINNEKKKISHRKKSKKYEKEDTISNKEESTVEESVSKPTKETSEKNYSFSFIGRGSKFKITENKKILNEIVNELIEKAYEKYNENIILKNMKEKIEKKLETEKIEEKIYEKIDEKLEENLGKTSSLENDTDTAYSSNLSDHKYNTLDNKSKKQKKNNKKNQFFLYTVNPIKEKESMSSIRKLSNVSANSNSNQIYSSQERKNSAPLVIEKPSPMKLDIKRSSSPVEDLKLVDNPTLQNIKIESGNKNLCDKFDNIKLDIENLNTNSNSPKNSTTSSTHSQRNVNITINSPVYNNYYIINQTQNQNQNNIKNNDFTNMIFNQNEGVGNFTSMTNNNMNTLNNMNNINNFTSFYPSPAPFQPNNFAPITIPQSFNNFIPSTNPLSNFNNMNLGYQNPYLSKAPINYMNLNNSSSTSPNIKSRVNKLEDFSHFINYMQLQNDILAYSKQVSENISLLKNLKLSMINKLENLIKESLSKNKNLIKY